MKISRVLFAAFTLSMFLCSCGAEPETTPVEPAKKSGSAAPKGGAPAANPDVTAMLAAADAYDGKTDKVVSKCAGCALGMAGKGDHALEVASYSLHFCADGCKDQFAKDTEKNVLAMKVPGR